MKQLFLYFLLLALLTAGTPDKKKKDSGKPNIIIIYIDDLGFGDIGINGAQGVSTPHVDFLAQNGVNFRDAHASASTCTPSRYSLLTGSYAFRNKTAILPGDAPLIIENSKGTLPGMLQRAGYKTGVVGKWHLGLGNGKVDWNSTIHPGPSELGFDYSFLIPATGDRVPCVFVENQMVVGLDPLDPIRVSYTDPLSGYPLGSEHPEILKVKADPQHSNTIVNGVSRIGYMQGGTKALWKDEDFPFVLTGKARDFIKASCHQPFFLYLSYHDIHVPRVPNSQFKGKSTMGPRGDAIVQMDWCTGQILDELRDLGLEENTLIIFSSDNGPILEDGYDDQALELVGNHRPGGPFRGAKYSAYEAGTRMPTLVYWPGHVVPGKSNALISQVDLFASLAHLAGGKILPGEAPDSRDYLDTWLGRNPHGRASLLEESYTFSFRKGKWKYIAPQTQSTPEWLKNKAVETGLSPEVQLYDLDLDPGEKKNVAGNFPEVVKEMQMEMIQEMK